MRILMEAIVINGSDLVRAPAEFAAPDGRVPAGQRASELATTRPSRATKSPAGFIAGLSEVAAGRASRNMAANCGAPSNTMAMPPKVERRAKRMRVLRVKVAVGLSSMGDGISFNAVTSYGFGRVNSKVVGFTRDLRALWTAR